MPLSLFLNHAVGRPGPWTPQIRNIWPVTKRNGPQNLIILASAAEKQLQREAEIKENRKQLVAILPTPFWALFWISVVNNAGSILFSENLLGHFPVFNTIGQGLSILLAVAMFYFLMRLQPADTRFRSAGWSLLASMVCSIISLALQAMDAAQFWLVVVSICGAVANICRIYYEFEAYSENLYDFDLELAEKWSKLSMLTILSLVGYFVGLFIALVFPVVGMLILLAALICMLVAAFKELFYRYRSAEAVSIPEHLL